MPIFCAVSEKQSYNKSFLCFEQNIAMHEIDVDDDLWSYLPKIDRADGNSAHLLTDIGSGRGRSFL